jgi:oligoendopeptidase F
VLAQLWAWLGFRTARLALRDRYIGLLSAGGSSDAFSLIKEAGVDLSLAEPYSQALKRFEGAVSTLESML